jgi:hypothetical protein
MRQPSKIELPSQERRVLPTATRLKGNSAASQNIPRRLANGRKDCAVEETPVRTVTEIVVGLPSATVEGVILHVEFAGNPAHVNIAVPETFAAELSRSG